MASLEELRRQYRDLYYRNISDMRKNLSIWLERDQMMRDLRELKEDIQSGKEVFTFNFDILKRITEMLEDLEMEARVQPGGDLYPLQLELKQIEQEIARKVAEQEDGNYFE